MYSEHINSVGRDYYNIEKKKCFILCNHMRIFYNVECSIRIYILNSLYKSIIIIYSNFTGIINCVCVCAYACVVGCVGVCVCGWVVPC